MGATRTKVLLIDDDEDSYIIIRELLSRVQGAAIDLDWTGTFDEGRAAIQRCEHDAYLIDYRLGAQDGIELLRIATAAGCRAPMIIITGQGEQAVEMQALQEGAADYLVKGQLSGTAIEHSIRYAIERSRAEEQRLKHEAQVRILTEQLPAILWTTDDQLRCTSSWGGGLLGLNLRPNDLVGQTLFQYFQTDDEKHPVIENHRRALRGESVSFQYTWQGRMFRVQINGLQGNAHRLVGTVGIALDITDAKQLEDEFNAARKIQEALLPNLPPRIPGFDVAGVCRPAAATGGDYYDFITMPNGSLGIVIADVSGHGFASALITMETRRLLRTLVRFGSDLSEILSAANLTIAEHAETSHKFVTLFFACFDPATRSLIYTGAGHEAYVFDAQGAVRTLESTALPLGVLEDAQFPWRGPLTLAPGELLLLFTDGIDESQNRAKTELFEKRRVFETVRAHWNRSSAEMIRAVLSEVRNFCHPGLPQDDLTMVLLKVNADG